MLNKVVLSGRVKSVNETKFNGKPATNIKLIAEGQVINTFTYLNCECIERDDIVYITGMIVSNDVDMFVLCDKIVVTAVKMAQN